MKNKKFKVILPIILVILAVVFYFCKDHLFAEKMVYSESVMTVPTFSGDPYVIINNNQPEFTEDDYTDESYEYYAPQDKHKRCTLAMACVGYDLMPTDDRGSISSVTPSGWVQAQYDISLLFRGSSNQRLIDMSATRAAGHAVLWQPPQL